MSSGPASGTRAGRPGAPNTWWRSRAGSDCRS